MENIFKDAYLGKQYILKNNKKAVYVTKGSKFHYLAIEDNCSTHVYFDNGTSYYSLSDEYDVVSEMREEIDEEELAHLSSIAVDEHVPECGNGQWTKHDLDAMYRKGFRKAMEVCYSKAKKQ